MTGRQAHTTAAVSIAAVRIRKIATPPEGEEESTTLSPPAVDSYCPRAGGSLGLLLTAGVLLVVGVKDKVQDPRELQHTSQRTDSEDS